MTVIDIQRDLEALTLTVTAEFAASPERVWQLYADPRQLERWWGPPEWPATFVRHEFVPGGVATYYMSGPDGEKPTGWWRILSAEPPVSFEVEDGFGDSPEEATPGMAVMRMAVRLERTSDGTRMTSVSTFASLEQLEQVVAMGIEEGLRGAMGQIDAILAAD
jgi:uncharacterized protein YndB with AHSA1/START domain